MWLKTILEVLIWWTHWLHEALSTGHLLNVCTYFSPLDQVSIVSILYMQFRGYVMNACNASWRAQVLDRFLSPLPFYHLYVISWRLGFFFFQFYDASKYDDKWGQQLLISFLHEPHRGFYTWEQCHTTMQNFIKGRASPAVLPLARR